MPQPQLGERRPVGERPLLIALTLAAIIGGFFLVGKGGKRK